MADEARLIFELVDRSGNSSAPRSQSAPQGPQPSGPGDPVDDANQRNRPQSPHPTAPQPVSPVAPESPRPASPTVQPSAQPDSRWGDLVGSLTEIAKALGLTATLQQTVAGQVLSFGMRAYAATEKAAEALAQLTKAAQATPATPSTASPAAAPAETTPKPASPQESAPQPPATPPSDTGGVSDREHPLARLRPAEKPDSSVPIPPATEPAQPGSRPAPVQPATTAVETVQPAAPVQPMPEAPRPSAPEPPERSPYDNGDVIDGNARPALPDNASRPALPAPTAPEPPEAISPSVPAPQLPSTGPLPPSPPLPPPTAGVPATPAPTGLIPAASAGVPAIPAATGLAVPAASAGAVAPTLAAAAAPVAAVAVPLAVVAAGAYAGYKTYEATSNAARQIAASPVGSLSPDIARANAEQSVRELAANLLTAARVGDLIGDNVGAQGRLRAELQELRDTVLATTLPATNKLTDAVAGVLTIVNKIIEMLGGEKAGKFIGEAFVYAIDQHYGGVLSWLARQAENSDAEMRRKALAESPIGAFEALPLPSLPAPFAATDDMPLDAKFSPIPGLGL